MAKLNVTDLSGQTVGEIELSDSVFAAEVKEHLLWEVVKQQRAAVRAGTHSTLRRNEVRGGGKKPYRQKGTGRARQGSSRAPNHVGGGKVFSPKPRDYEYTVPKKVKQAALRSALSLRAREQKLLIVRDFDLGEVKTRRMHQALKALGAPSALVVDQSGNDNLKLSVRNLALAKYLAQEGLNVYDILNHPYLILSSAAARAIDSRLSTAAEGKQS